MPPFIVPLLISTVFLIVYFSRRSRGRRLPPGPPGHILFGNSFDIPEHHYWKTYRKWSLQYKSDLICLNVFGSPLIVVNTPEAAKELMERRSYIYASRPQMPMANELVGFTFNLGFMAYGEEWRECRKIAHRFFETPRQLEFRPLSLEATRVLLQNVKDDPTNIIGDIRLMTGSFILRLAYGLDVKSKDDPHLVRVERTMLALGQSMHGFWVDFLPFLSHIPMWFPGASFKVKAAEWRKDVIDSPNIPFEFAKASMKEKPLPNGSIISDLLSDLSNTTDEDKLRHKEAIAKKVLGTLYIAASDTTVVALSHFILAMVQYPDIQKRGQEAVDRILEGKRLPDFTDYGAIPYIDALEREVLRWRPVAPVGIPYSPLQDDEYDGYSIPSGCTVFVNAWALLHSEATFGPDPDAFNPERFMKGDQLDPDVPYPSAAFGQGRRVCVGMKTARESIWITIASILAVFQIEPAYDEQGRPFELPSEDDYVTATLFHPPPFKYTIRPRSDFAAQLIEDSRIESL